MAWLRLFFSYRGANTAQVMRERKILRKYSKRFTQVPFDGLGREWFGSLGFHEIDSIG
ncbi:MAG: hypothetical protein RL403_1333 [Bacteroidota bacterium]|jgi:hypothetical protein